MTYDDWNRAIADHFTCRAAQGALVYLTIDDGLLSALGREGGIDAEEAVAGFCDAVRSPIWVGASHEISLSTLYGRCGDGRPRGVAFLALMVLAANRMGDNEESEINYFTQLRRLLRLDVSRAGRPAGMRPAGVEEPLWREWARYLEQHGRFSSARQGKASPTRFINYPLSQTLLRYTDCQRLTELFSSQRYFRTYREPDLLMARVAASREQLTPRLREKLRETGDRFVALTQAVFDVHEWFLRSSSADDRDHGERRSIRTASTALTADLIRAPGGFRRPPRYELVPRLKAGLGLRSAADPPEVEVAGTWLPLAQDPEHAAAARPVGPVSPEEIVEGARFALRGAGTFTEIILPPRPFHILVSDPDLPESGIYVSGRLPATDTHFLFLGSEEAVSDLRRLRDMGMLKWQSEHSLGVTDWREVEGCMILADDWSHARIGNAELFNALRPRRRITIGVTGGLRAPEGFLAGVLPQFTASGTQPGLFARILDISGETERNVWEGEIQARSWTALPASVADKPGLYRLEVGTGDEPERRLLRIIDWDELRSTPVGSWPDQDRSTDPLARGAWAPGS
jgi:hypothetical protein